MKTNLWPYGIVLSLVLFGGMILYFVFRAMQSDVNLVHKDYYEVDKSFNQHQLAAHHAEQLQGQIGIEAQTDRLLISLPPGAPIDKGTIYLYRPSNSKLDFSVPLQPDEQRRQQLNTAQMAKGYWKAKLYFEQQGKSYYKEFDFRL